MLLNTSVKMDIVILQFLAATLNSEYIRFFCSLRYACYSFGALTLSLQ